MSELPKLLVMGMVILKLCWSFHLVTVAADTGCPLDFSTLDFTTLTSVCSEQNIGRCCRYVHALVGISLAQYANATSQIGVPSLLAEACKSALLNNLLLSGLAPNATAFCGLGTKITFDILCKDLKTVEGIEQIPKFNEVHLYCMKPVSSLGECQVCLNASIMFIRHLQGAKSNLTLSICRDATFVAIASHGNLKFAIDKASCFFGIQGLGGQPVMTQKDKPFFPVPSPALPPTLDNPSTSANSTVSFVKKADSSHWMLIMGIGVGLTGFILSLFFFLLVLIQRKRKVLKNSEESNLFKRTRNLIPTSCRQSEKWTEGRASVFRRFSYKEIRMATDDFSTIIGRGGFGSVYKGRFQDGLVAAVKQIDGLSGQGEKDFLKEMELLGRLHHRHLVTLKGFCSKRYERFLVYEYMENGSLKEHLHGPTKTSFNWITRIQIAADIAAALEYLHCYCDPRLCHGDIKSSNILLDVNFLSKLADFGLARASPSDGNNSQHTNSDIRGTPGYMDPEYIITQQLTLKSDIYSYGVLLLELISGRKAVYEKTNLVEWAQKYILEESEWPKMVDPNLADTYRFEELKCVINIARMCTQREGEARPSITKVLHLLYNNLDVVSPDVNKQPRQPNNMHNSDD